MTDAAYPIGFIGVGTIGEAMTLTLVKDGMDVAREAADVFAQPREAKRTGTMRIVEESG
jgi:3-hydroxyisobutyrate dehydrogenase-like beta-hydroxyacid dehydrogenase